MPPLPAVYTFQPIPWALSCSGYVFQVNFPALEARFATSVSSSGPPWRPSKSSVADIA